MLKLRYGFTANLNFDFRLRLHSSKNLAARDVL